LEGKRVTLDDVAKLAGVSTGTVSRVINNRSAVSENARKKVEKAIKKLNYTPHSIARSLATGVSNAIFLSIIEENPILPSTWRYELPVVQGIYDYLRNTSFTLQIGISFVEESQHINFFENLIKDKFVDGLLILSAWPIDYRSLLHLEERKIPYVLVGCKSSVQTRVEVGFDNSGAMSAIVEHLIKLGHQKFALIGGYKDQLHMADRTEGFVRALKFHGLPVYQNLMIFGDYQIESGYRCMMQLLKETPKPTAIVCGNDYMAAGAIKAIKDTGFRVPGDFSVTGFDDSEVSKVVDPALTTVRIPVFEMGHLAVKKLHRLIREGKKEKDITILPFELIIRTSTTKCNKN